MLPAVLISPANLFSGAGGLAAAIAVGAFLGQGWATFASLSDLRRRQYTAVGGSIGFAAMIGLILLSVSGS